MTAVMQAALFNIRKRHHPKPAPYAFAGVPDATLNSGKEITIIDRDYRVAVSNGVTWKWRGTTDDIS